MEVSHTLYLTDRVAWRLWLEEHHHGKREVWLLFYKKHTGKPCIPYDDAVEEALCFGWIDSVVKRIDDERYAQKFTPRRPGGNWSESNRRRVRKLIAEGRMTDAGLATIDPAIVSEEPPAKPARRALVVPRFIKQALMADPEAWAYFQAQPPSHRREYISWITEAKKDETRARRLRETIALLKKERKSRSR